MKDEQSDTIKRAPVIIWCVRLCFCVFIWCVVKSWFNGLPLTIIGRIVLCATMAVNGTGLLMSFIHSRTSLILLVACVVVVPLIMFVFLDYFLRGAWWEWYMLLVQMGIPIAVAYYMWKARMLGIFILRTTSTSSGHRKVSTNSRQNADYNTR